MAELLDISSDDWQMYYYSTIVGKPVKDKILPFYVDNIEKEKEDGELKDIVLHGSIVHVVRKGKDTGKTSWKKATALWVADDIIIDFPVCGLFNKDNYVIYLSHKAIKQWKRSLNQSQVKAGSPVYKELAELGIRVGNAGQSDIAYILFNPEYPGAKEALWEVQAGAALARAFSNDFCFHIKKGVSRVLLTYRDQICGYTGMNVVYLDPAFSHLEHELSEFIEVEYE